jgi:hypothetical protein
MKLDDHKKHTLISELDMIWQKLREKDYEITILMYIIC